MPSSMVRMPAAESERERRERAKCTGPTCRSASGAEGEATQRLWRGRLLGFPGRDQAQRDQRVLEHQGADVAEQKDVERADHHVDLAARLKRAEDRRADKRADEAADDHDAAHLQVRTARAQMGHDARHARAGDLGCCGSDRDGRRNAVEDQQRRGEEAAADPEHSGQDADKPAKRDDQQRVDRLAGDGKVDVHRQ